MKESEQSLNLKKLNSDYLNLFFSPEVVTVRRKKGICGRIKLLFSFIRTGRLKEVVVRLKGAPRNINRDIGVKFMEDDDRDYYGNKKVVVYTAVFGMKIPINNPMYCNPSYEYYIFTDQDIPDGSHWKKMKFDELTIPQNLDNAGKNRWFKMHPHLYFNDFDYSVYVDGGIIIVADFMPWIEAMDGKILGTHVLSLPLDCVYESAKTVIGAKKAPKLKVMDQMRVYKEEGYPIHNGMYENGVLIRNHMDSLCVKLMEEWWNQLLLHTMRDQLSLGYVLWKNKIKKDEILLLGDNIFMNPRIRFWDL